MRVTHRAAVFGALTLCLGAIPRGADACGGALWEEAAHRRAPDLVAARKRAAARPPEAIATELVRAQERLEEGNESAAIRLVRTALPDIEEYDARWAKPHVARALRTLSLAIVRSPLTDLKQRDFAVATLERLVQRDDDDPIARTDLGEALAARPDRAAEGRAMLEALAQDDLVVHSGGFAALARGRVALGDEAGARVALGRCVQMATSSLECRVTIPGAPSS